MRKNILAAIALIALVACNQPKNEPTKEMNKKSQIAGLVEITTFKLNKAIASDDFMKVAEQMQTDFLKNQKGFIKRTLTVSGDTLWTDIVYWENMESHSQAMQIAEKSTAVAPFFEKIDFSSVKMNVTKPMLSNE
jgi:hypothetical protein